MRVRALELGSEEAFCEQAREGSGEDVPTARYAAATRASDCATLKPCSDQDGKLARCGVGQAIESLGGSCWDRTNDQQIKSLLLYRLS